jgi:hypothetical protein
MRNKLLDDRPTYHDEMILIRVGHHLWKSGKRKEWPAEALSSALDDVWSRKEELRVGYRKAWLEMKAKTVLNLAQAREKRRKP